MFQTIANIIKQAYVSSNAKDSNPYPQLQVTFNGKPTNAVRLEPYGMWSMPPEGSLSVILSVLGSESTLYAISNDYLTRPINLNPGEVVHGAFKFGAYNYFDQTGQNSMVGSKVYIGSSSISLIAKLNLIIDEILAATFPTAVGPTGTIINPANLTQIKADLTSIEGSYSALDTVT